MQWSGDGILLSVKAHGENSAVVEVLTRDNGRWLGLVRAGRSRAMRPVLQPGNVIAATWRARLAEHLGQFTIEPKLFVVAGVIDDPMRLAGLSALSALARVLPEREPHPAVYDAFMVVLGALDDDDVWPALLARWELGLLDELGFGLDLKACAKTGETSDLVYVSPKSGRAVSAGVGRPYHAKLLVLPAFLHKPSDTRPDRNDLASAFALTGYFLNRHVFEPRRLDLPEARARLVRLLRGCG